MKAILQRARIWLAKVWYAPRVAPVEHGQVIVKPEIVTHDVLVCRAVIYRTPVYKLTPTGSGMYYTAQRIHAAGVISSRPADGAPISWSEVIKAPRKLADGIEVSRGDVVEFQETIEKREVS